MFQTEENQNHQKAGKERRCLGEFHRKEDLASVAAIAIADQSSLSVMQKSCYFKTGRHTARPQKSFGALWSVSDSGGRARVRRTRAAPCTLQAHFMRVGLRHRNEQTGELLSEGKIVVSTRPHSPTHNRRVQEERELPAASLVFRMLVPLLGHPKTRPEC